MRVLKKTIKIVGLFFGIILAFSALTLWWFSPLPPLFDDGPFHGEPSDVSDRGVLKQSFTFRDGMTLQVFSNSNSNKSPIVQLITQENKIKWAIFANGIENSAVSDLEFTNVECFPLFLTCNVTGYVIWTYGKERMNWHIWKWGNLRKYYYSW